MTTLRIYKSYSFRTKDPVIDELRTLIADEGARYSEVHEASGVATTTLYNWFKGPTMRPQSASIEAVGRSIGYRRKWVRMPKKNGRDRGA